MTGYLARLNQAAVPDKEAWRLFVSGREQPKVIVIEALKSEPTK